MTKPKIIVNVAASLDGYIGFEKGSYALSDTKDWQRVHRLRKRVDAILVGINTVLNDNPFLTVRYVHKPKVHPLRVVLDTRLRIPLSSNILQDQTNYPTVIFTSHEANKGKINNLLSKGVSVVAIAKDENNLLDIKHMLEILSTKFNVKKLLIEGGATIITEFINKQLIDEMYIYYSPVLLGSEATVPIYLKEVLNSKNPGTGKRKFKVDTVAKFGEGFIVKLLPIYATNLKKR